MKRYICIDIGGTAIKYGIIDDNAHILIRDEIPTEAEKGGSFILERILKIVEDYVKNDDISGVCISTAGMVDVEKGEIVYSAQLIPDYIGVNFKEIIEQRFGIPCEVENDVNCAGIAEYMSGASKGYKYAMMLTIGTGIGGCMILNGEILHGGAYSACEVGYMSMHDSDFHTLGAASILSQKVAGRKQESTDLWTGYHIFEQAKKGDEICISAIDEMCEILGEGIANLCYVLNPEIIVLGGGIMAQKDFLCERINRAVDKYLLARIRQHTQIVFAKHKNNAGMLGAYYHFKKRHN